MCAFKASWLALVTWHPGTGHLSRCRDALDGPAPAISSTLAVGAQVEQSCLDLVPSSPGRPSSSAAPPCRFSALCLHPPLGPHRRHRRPAVHRFFSSFLEMFPVLLAASALTLSCTALSNLKLNSCSSSSSLAQTCSASISASLWILCYSSLLNRSCFTASTCSLSKFMCNLSI